MIFLEKTFIVAYIYAVILLQIILESFPVSSSGHLKLLEAVLHRSGWQAPVSFHAFGFNEELLHIPTIFIILIFFSAQWRSMFYAIRASKTTLFSITKFVFIADAITVLFYGVLKYYPLTLPLGIGFLITAALLYSLRYCSLAYKKFSWQKYDACILGIVQGVALLPGISRFAITFVGARWLRLSPRTAFMLSFFIEVPLLVAGVAKGFWAVSSTGHATQLLNIDLWCIMVGAGIVAYGGLMIIAKMIDIHRLWLVSFYMIIPAILWFCIQ